MPWPASRNASAFLLIARTVLRLLKLTRLACHLRRFFKQFLPAQTGNFVLNAGGIVLLQPVMRLEIVTPDESLGNIQADLNARRASIVNSERRGDHTHREACYEQSPPKGWWFHLPQDDLEIEHERCEDQ